MASRIAPPHIRETRTIEIELKPILRKILNIQDRIKDEIQYNVKEMPYTPYIEKMKGMTGGSTNITTKLLDQLFSAYPEFDRIKESIVLSTHRTMLTTDSGLEGETFFHTDGVFFPTGKDSNLIITWGLGTESATIDLSHLIEGVRGQVRKNFQNTRNLDLFATFREEMLVTPLKTIEKYKSIHITKETDEFNKIVKEEYDKLVAERGELYLGILSSKAPNESQNITALIMAGKEAYHRRITTEEIQKKPIYRYSLNIYFNAEDLQKATKTGSPATKTGSPKTGSPKTGSPATKTDSPATKTGSPAPKTGPPATKTVSPKTGYLAPKTKTSWGGQKNKTRKNKSRKNKTR